MKPQFCSYCGAHLNEAAQFCHICGRALITAQVPQPEPVVQPAPAPAAQPKPQKVRTPRARHRRTAGASALCVLIFLCSFLLIMLVNVRSLTSQDTLEQSMKEMLSDVDLTRVPARDLIPSADPGDSLAAHIAQEIEKSYVVEIRVDEDDVQEFLEESTFMPYFAEKISEYAADIRNDRRGTGITQRELERLLWENEDEIEDLTGIPLTNQDVAEVLKQAEAEGAIGSLRAKALKEDTPEIYGVARAALSDVTIIVLVVLIIGMAVLLAKSYKWNIFQACGSLGNILSVSGGIFLVLILGAVVLSLVWNSVISHALQAVMVQGLWASGIAFALGIILVIVDKISVRILKNS